MACKCAYQGDRRTFAGSDASGSGAQHFLPYAKEGCVYQESEKMIYSWFDWTRLLISYLSCSGNLYKRSLMLNHTILPNFQDAKEGGILRLFSCPSDLFNKAASRTSNIDFWRHSTLVLWWFWQVIKHSWEIIGAQAFVLKTWIAVFVDILVSNQGENKWQSTHGKPGKEFHIINHWIHHQKF